jgi:deoxyribodipyrimidine photo-lyase
MKSIKSLASDPRVTVRRDTSPKLDGNAVVYWMQRAQRVVNNPALETAIKAANALGKPVVVYFGLSSSSKGANLRHYHFMIQGLQDVAEDLKVRRIGFFLRHYPDHSFLKFCEDIQPSLIIGDENPLREAERTKEAVKRKVGVPFWTVDADVIVPSRLLLKEQYAARTIRPRIHAQLDQYLTPVGRTSVRFPWNPAGDFPSPLANAGLLDGLPIDRSVQPVGGFQGGPKEGLRVLNRFIQNGLKGYATARNNPEMDGTSQLSPYLHFGNIGAHTVALAVNNSGGPAEDRKAFLEELIVRRELAINFVRFNPVYDSIKCAEGWAIRTLRDHAEDPRPYVYGEKALENAETHDPLWNAAQKQMVISGWMHGYLRMYWAKKILEWTCSPEEAYEIAVRLNDRYELDGRDPNGYAGIAWAIAGKHDRAWGPERPIFGKVRFMSYQSTSRKFDSQAYIKKIERLERGN